MNEMNALPLEYKGYYGTARGDFDISNIINNPAATGKCRVLGLSLSEESLRVLLAELSSRSNQIAQPCMIADDVV